MVTGNRVNNVNPEMAGERDENKGAPSMNQMQQQWKHRPSNTSSEGHGNFMSRYTSDTYRLSNTLATRQSDL